MSGVLKVSDWVPWARVVDGKKVSVARNAIRQSAEVIFLNVILLARNRET